MEYTIKAIPTTYRGVKFRSRLEARWAAFFDLTGQSWTYEPYDLDGWAPDFEIKTGAGRLLIEVKPFLWEDKDPFDFIDQDLRRKVGRYNGIIVGAELNPEHGNFDESHIRNVLGIQVRNGGGWCESRLPFAGHLPADEINRRVEDKWRTAAGESKREYA